MQFLEHVRYAFVAFMPPPDVGLAHTVPPVFPRITSGSQDHERQQPRRGEAKRLSFDELYLNDAARLGELIPALGLQGCGYAHRTTRSALARVVLLSRY